MRRRWWLPGAAITTIGGPTAAWVTRPPPRSPPAVWRPLRLRLRSSQTAAVMKSKRYPFPKPYSHNPWYRKWGQISHGGGVERAQTTIVNPGGATLRDKGEFPAKSRFGGVSKANRGRAFGAESETLRLAAGRRAV